MAKARVAILISGQGTNMAALLYAAQNPSCSYEIALVASNNPQAPGLKLAEAEGITTFAHAHMAMTRADHDAVMYEAIMSSGSEYIALAGYMRILSDGFVNQWQGRMLNIHPSLLPKYKGLNTHQSAIDAGDRYAGCSVHVVTPALDDGPVLGKIKVAILKGDTAATLATRVKMAEHQLYPRILAEYVSREHSADWLLHKIRKLALTLPQTHERESHGTPGWRAGTEKAGKYFAYFSDRHHGSDAIGVLVKTSGMDELLSLCEDQPDIYWKPAYWGASGWAGIRLNRANVDWDHIAEWLERSWFSVAPKSLTKLRNAAEQF